ncbi:glycosyltransferase [Oscillatoria sp. FACHB-1407]|uniref:glycosyltransferase n=1 Tax=Oscillatoria sp. FACHB-1407 TaxID=2692847 RepID=UPI001684CB6E|nr:glycosyltransferase [Oscillatoria sp. FACHB-1407]MBD2465493.1 glycosyltransferase [Oscillatoria sp. FACHB-1407]
MDQFYPVIPIYQTAQNKPAYALISVHGDPSIELGREGAGGQNLYVRSLGLALARRGCQVDMFTRRESPDQEAIVELAPGCRTIRLDAGPARFIPRTELFEYLPAFVEAWLLFVQQSGQTYELIHTNYWLSGWVGLQIKFSLGLPQVHTFHSIGAVKYGTIGTLPFIAQTRLNVEQQCLEQVDCVIATSPQEAITLRQAVSRKGQIRVIPCGINIQHFASVSKTAARQLLQIKPETRMILYVGRFDGRKGIETLVAACGKLLQPFQLYLVGGSRSHGSDAQEQQRIRAIVKDLGLEAVTTFTGPIPQKHLPPYYAAADVCVVPSYYEPFGLVAIEAMAAKTPVIASDVGGLQYSIVHNETGVLVPPRNAAHLAAAIADVFVNPERWKILAEAGQQRVQSRFSVSAVAAQIHQIYQCVAPFSSIRSAG